MYKKEFACLFLRLALGLGFLSAVASRLSFWGKASSGWTGFVDYTAQVNSFLPKNMIPPIAVVSTVLETSLGLMLILGIKIKYAAYGAAVLSLIFSLAMAYSFGIKEPLDYSVFAFSAGSYLLGITHCSKWSIDNLFYNQNKNN